MALSRQEAAHRHEPAPLEKPATAISKREAPQHRACRKRRRAAQREHQQGRFTPERVIHDSDSIDLLWTDVRLRYGGVNRSQRRAASFGLPSNQGGNRVQKEAVACK